MMTMKHRLTYRFFISFVLCVSFTFCECSDLRSTGEERMNPTGNEEPPTLQKVVAIRDKDESAIKEKINMLGFEDISEKANIKEINKRSDWTSDSVLPEINDRSQSLTDRESNYENQEASTLEEKDTWFVEKKDLSGLMSRSPFCVDSDAPELIHETMELPPFLCNDLIITEEDKSTKEVRRTYKPRPVIQYIDPITHKTVTLLRPPTLTEVERGGHFYLGTEVQDRFYNPNTIEEDNEKFKSIPCRCGQSTYNSNFRVVNGWDIKPHTYPFMVSVQNLTQHHFCGGMIICNSFVLTAAHCIQGALPHEILVQIGDHDISSDITDSLQSPFQKTVKVHSIITNFQYKPKSRDYDIALLRLKEDIRFNRHVGAVCLPDPLEIDMDSQEAKVVGWGVIEHGSKTISTTPKETKVKTMSKEKCAMSQYEGEKITDTMMCASGRKADACQGDSGGPLLWKRYNLSGKATRIDEVAIGIVSWGKGCGLKSYPGVYTDLTNPETLEWIYANTKSCSYCQ